MQSLTWVIATVFLFLEVDSDNQRKQHQPHTQKVKPCTAVVFNIFDKGTLRNTLIHLTKCSLDFKSKVIKFVGYVYLMTCKNTVYKYQA